MKLVKNLKGSAIPIMMKKFVTALSLIALGVLARLYFHHFLPSAPNIYITIAGIQQPVFIPGDVFFMIAIISLIAGRYLGGYFAFVVPFSTMMITDVFIGNNFIFLFTWSGFALMGMFGLLMQKHSFSKFIAFSIPAIIVYDLWTNFGWWMGGYYGHNLHGLLLCYILAIPFMLWHLISTMLVLPVFALPFEKISLTESKSKVAKYATISSTAFLISLALLI
ncbi:MAG: hypothetical protein FE041_01580 [Thermoplasmata archaeon]|nr:MAG: hypothetical protein FE041_01580 [Thermoplasmata archaeon]